MPRWARPSSTRRTWSGRGRRSPSWWRRPPPAPSRRVAASTPDLLPRLAAFARLLHDAGLDAGPGRLTTATRALGAVELGDRAAFRDSLRACFVSRKDELPIFEAAFDIFWTPPDARLTAGQIPGRSRALPLPPERARAWLQALGLNQSRTPRQAEEDGVPPSSSGYSEKELLRQKDFEDMNWTETDQVRRLLQQAPWRIAERRTRRLRPSRGGRVDLRRTARQSIRSSGELIHLLHRQPRLRRRPIVLLC